jgi:cysteinyl-tRNA synthetase
MPLQVAKSSIPSSDKLDLLYFFDEVLGLNLSAGLPHQIPKNVLAIKEKRDKLRAEGKFSDADALRREIESMGYQVKDTELGSVILPVRHA